MTVYRVMALNVFLFVVCALAGAKPASAFAFPPQSGRTRHRHFSSEGSVETSDSGDAPSPSLPPPSVLCVGETLWDSLPTGIYLGGAPSNVAVHLASLFSSSPSDNHESSTVAIAACLGDDQLGREAHRRLSIKGVRTDYIQFHGEWETGMATAILDDNGDATYSFITPAAWDGLELNDQLLDLVKQSDEHQQRTIFILGTIAGRLGNEHGAMSWSTLKTIRNSAPEGAVVLDVNLRSPWYTPETVLELARGSAPSEEERANELAMLKLNEDELCILEEWCGVQRECIGEDKDRLSGLALKQRMEGLAASLNTKRVCVTRGKDGAALLCKGDDEIFFCENSGYQLTLSADSDTVGAGDAFLAALVGSLIIGEESPERALERACALGGYVAACRGATPDHQDAPDDLRSMFSAKR